MRNEFFLGMHTKTLRQIGSTLAVALLLSGKVVSAEQIIELWPAGAPGEKGNLGEERDTTKPTDGLVAGKPVVRLGNVSQPTITLYRPPADKDSGTAVMVCPGGGYSILAMDLEGTEVCDWLNSIGVTGVLLKYRVPKREGMEKYAAPLQDAQRALGLVREHALEWKMNPQRIGVLGFSAGGHLAAAASCNYERRTYPVVDAADAVSCRPDFTLLIYPAYLTTKTDGDSIAPELTITTNTPPTFLAMAEDDPVRIENALFYTLALKNAHVPAELHIYPTGGHGYGLRRTQQTVTTWPDRVTDWLLSRGLLKKE
jgi:acetyl esterase/lipase